MESCFDAAVAVRRVRFVSPRSGWAVLDAAAPDGAWIVLVGPLAHLETGERAHVTGSWVDDRRYGRQVKVAQAAPLAPDEPEALIAYLSRVKHVGARRAQRLVAEFGASAVVDAIDTDPTGAFGAVGLRRARAEQAADSWRELRVTRRLHMLLAPHGLAYLAPRIHEHYGAQAHRIVSQDPYELTSLFGVGFLIADRIARAVLVGDGEARMRAAIVHALSEAERSGSTCLPIDTLRAAAGELLGQSPSPTEIGRLVEAEILVADEGWIYRPQTAALEAELAGRVRELVSGSPVERLRAPEDPRAGPGASQLTKEQSAALQSVFVNRLSLITGGPGTGKTASIRAIAAAGARQGARVLLVAPTGRAAIRMSEASGVRARTVHSALGWVPGEGPTHDEQDPLRCELLIVDETSMANLELLVTLLRAVDDRTHVVLVGDADQLAPVGAGKPFAELVGTETVPTVRLTHIFRQAAGSMIVQGAHAIRRGEMPELTPLAGMRRDLFLIERHDPPAALAEIVSLVSDRLPAHYGLDPVRDIQVFAPVYRGELGIDAINTALREALNPDGHPIRGGRLRLGDKLMMTGRNLHELGLMNGTLLRLLDEVSPSPGAGSDEEAALILGSEESIFRLPPEESDRLRLAYACSVHRGQGIELPIAVIVAHPAAGAFFLRREMLYTAVTRARIATIIVGTRAVIEQAARTPDTGRRHGRLAARMAVGPQAAVVPSGGAGR